MYIKFCNFNNYAEEKKSTAFKNQPGTELNGRPCLLITHSHGVLDEFLKQITS